MFAFAILSCISRQYGDNQTLDQKRNTCAASPAAANDPSFGGLGVAAWLILDGDEAFTGREDDGAAGICAGVDPKVRPSPWKLLDDDGFSKQLPIVQRDTGIRYKVWWSYPTDLLGIYTLLIRRRLLESDVHFNKDIQI